MHYSLTRPDGPPTQCGVLGGHNIAIPNEYLNLWIEYIGDNPWDKNHKKIKHTCKSDISSISIMAMLPNFSYVEFDDQKNPKVIDYYYSYLGNPGEIDIKRYHEYIAKNISPFATPGSKGLKPEKYPYDDDYDKYYFTPPVEKSFGLIARDPSNPIRKIVCHPHVAIRGCQIDATSSKYKSRVAIRFDISALSHFREIFQATEQFMPIYERGDN